KNPNDNKSFGFFFHQLFLSLVTYFLQMAATAANGINTMVKAKMTIQNISFSTMIPPLYAFPSS
ncbi:hypothetical protein, partial [Gracilibacillus boraciitolerans]|uniref:hypothetical protein n=1 Tax=Gracilibacillus boraciitolerans TaxID=307521 RepID=UPI001F2E3FA5